MIKLDKKYKSGTALEILQEAILSGNITGEVTQNEIAISLGTSRMPVREALISLEYRGLIKRLHTQHAKIISLTDENIRSIFNDMALLEIELIKILPDEKIIELSFPVSQQNFHKSLIKNTNAPLREKTLEIFIEVYLNFVLQKSECPQKIEAVFANLLHALKPPIDLEVVRAGYSVYSEVLSNELIKIRKRKDHNVKLETS